MGISGPGWADWLVVALMRDLVRLDGQLLERWPSMAVTGLGGGVIAFPSVVATLPTTAQPVGPFTQLLDQ